MFNTSQLTIILQRLTASVESVKATVEANTVETKTRLTQMEEKLNSFLHQQEPTFNDEFEVDNEDNFLPTNPLMHYASPQQRAQVFLDAKKSRSRRNIDYLTPSTAKASNTPLPTTTASGSQTFEDDSNEAEPKADPAAAIGRRLTNLIILLTGEAYGQDQAENLSNKDIKRLKEPLMLLAKHICDLAQRMSKETPKKWKAVTQDDKLYYCLMFEERTCLEKLQPLGIEHCKDNWGARGFLRLAWKNARQTANNQKARCQAPIRPQEEIQPTYATDEEEPEEDTLSDSQRILQYQQAGRASNAIPTAASTSTPRKRIISRVETEEEDDSEEDHLSDTQRFLQYRRTENAKKAVFTASSSTSMPPKRTIVDTDEEDDSSEESHDGQGTPSTATPPPTTPARGRGRPSSSSTRW